MVFVVGLTGSIGMGKSAVSEMIRRAGVPVWDADAAVHELYMIGGKAVEPVQHRFPEAVVDGAVDRDLLSRQVLGNEGAIKDLEKIVHPLVGEHRQGFFSKAEADGHKLVVVDVPLLFETGGNARMDHVVVVSARGEQQRERVLARPGMSPEKFEAILARQVPDAEKRSMADDVVDTSTTLQATEAAVRLLLGKLQELSESNTQ
jgi:dephospho-CoA kinase